MINIRKMTSTAFLINKPFPYAYQLSIKKRPTVFNGKLNPYCLYKGDSWNTERQIIKMSHDPSELYEIVKDHKRKYNS